MFGIETTADPVAIHRRIGYLPGEFTLYDKLTGGQTIEYFANLRGGVDRAYQQDLIARLDVDPSRKFKEYSKGNKQKVGLVVALQHRPDLLILDEPTSGLDPLVQQTFYDLIREAKADGRTIFLSSHILGEVEKTCDRVAIIREGRLARSTASRPCVTSPTTRSSCASAATSRPRPLPRSTGSATCRPTTTSCACASRARSRPSCRKRPSTSCSTSSAASRRSRRRSSRSIRRNRWRPRHERRSRRS